MPPRYFHSFFLMHDSWSSLILHLILSFSTQPLSSFLLWSAPPPLLWVGWKEYMKEDDCLLHLTNGVSVSLQLSYNSSFSSLVLSLFYSQVCCWFLNLKFLAFSSLCIRFLKFSNFTSRFLLWFLGIFEFYHNLMSASLIFFPLLLWGLFFFSVLILCYLIVLC